MGATVQGLAGQLGAGEGGQGDHPDRRGAPAQLGDQVGALDPGGYLSEQGCWLTLPPGEPGAVDEVGVTVIPPPRRSRVTVTFRGVTVEDADALGGRLALRLAVGDQAARWPEAGAADVQDGKRFDLDQRFDLVLNPSSLLAVAIDGEAAGGSPAGEVRAPYLGLDDWGAGEHTYRSRPGPGAGDGPWTVELAIDVTPLDA